jgi:hypothetical protein
MNLLIEDVSVLPNFKVRIKGVRDYRADANKIVGSESDTNRFGCRGIYGEAGLGKASP